MWQWDGRGLERGASSMATTGQCWPRHGAWGAGDTCPLPPPLFLLITPTQQPRRHQRRQEAKGPGSFGVMDSPLVLLFAFFSWKWRKKLVQMMAVFGREGGLAKEMAGLLVDAQDSGNAATATDSVYMLFCTHSSAYFTRSRCAQNQHVPMSAALDAPASWLVRRPSLLRCCSWAAWLAA